MAVSAQERQFLLNQLTKLAVADLANLWKQADRLADIDFAAFVINAFPELVSPFSEAAAQLAATWFEQSSPSSSYVATTAPPIAEERLLSSARWALGGDGLQGLERLKGTMQRAVFDGARQTTLINVKQDPGSRWVRHARPDACAFCRLLATRYSDPKYWYHSTDSALKAGSSRRIRGARVADDYHDDCRCVAVEVREGQDYEPPEYVHEWNDQYDKAWANDGTGQLKGVLKQWRAQAPEIN